MTFSHLTRLYWSVSNSAPREDDCWHDFKQQDFFVFVCVMDVGGVWRNLWSYPIGCENDELVSLCELPVWHLRDSNNAVVFQAEVPKRTGHGKPRGVIKRKPHSRHFWLVVQGKHTAPALPDALCFPCCPINNRFFSKVLKQFWKKPPRDHGHMLVSEATAASISILMGD